ncbi:hypothetical protein BGZ83_004907, partial [Gryganskiella cystojenkinii]
NDPPVVSAEEGTETRTEEAVEEDGDDQWADEALTAEPEPTKRRTLSNLRHHELVERLAHFDLDVNTLKGKSRAELYAMAKEDRYRFPLASEAIVHSYGYKILWLPPYHPDLNPIEQAWGLTKNDVATVNDGSDFKLVGDYILNGFDNCDEHWANLVRHSNDVADAYIERDRIYIGPPREGGSEDEIDIDTDEEEDILEV